MISKLKYVSLILGATLVMTACNDGPKVIEPTTKTAESSNLSTEQGHHKNALSDTKLHAVVVQEVLPTTRYVYLKVEEGQDEFWIAAEKRDVKKGETYFYKGGLLKTDFESKEYNRIFKEIYLVSNLVSEEHHASLTKTEPKGTSVKEKAMATKEDIPTHTDKEITHKGLITIAELLKDPKKYEGHSVEIRGTCVKINPGILGRNWLHLQDGSKDDFDLVVTSNALVPKGAEVTIHAVVVLNRDFGSGYTYELLLENGTLVE